MTFPCVYLHLILATVLLMVPIPLMVPPLDKVILCEQRYVIHTICAQQYSLWYTNDYVHYYRGPKEKIDP